MSTLFTRIQDKLTLGDRFWYQASKGELVKKLRYRDTKGEKFKAKRIDKDSMEIISTDAAEVLTLSRSALRFPIKAIIRFTSIEDGRIEIHFQTPLRPEPIIVLFVGLIIVFLNHLLSNFLALWTFIIPFLIAVYLWFNIRMKEQDLLTRLRRHLKG